MKTSYLLAAAFGWLLGTANPVHGEELPPDPCPLPTGSEAWGQCQRRHPWDEEKRYDACLLTIGQKVHVGMAMGDVTAALRYCPEPAHINRSETVAGSIEQWVFRPTMLHRDRPTQYIYFQHGAVTRVDSTEQ
jgi:hypothetical protein